MGLNTSRPAQGSYTWHIKDFRRSTLQHHELCSEEFEIGEHKWHMCLKRRNGRPRDLVLISSGSGVLPEWWAPIAAFKVIIVSQNDRAGSAETEATHHFTKDAPTPGFFLVIDLMAYDSPYVTQDGTLQLRVEMQVHREYADRRRAKQVQIKGQHVWRIPDYRQTTERKLSSDIFDVGTYKWRLAIESSEQQGHLAVCLESLGSSFLPPWWAPSAGIKLVVVNQMDPAWSVVKEAGHHFKKGRASRGFDQLVPMDVLLAPNSPYFTEDGSLELRVEIEAKVRTPMHIAQQLEEKNGEDKQPSRPQPPQEARDKSTHGFLKLPPIRAQARRDCMVCMEPVPRGSVIYRQRGCTAFLCQDCTNFMCSSRADSSGHDGCNNGELICTTCTPHHPISPATLARTVPVQVFKRLQAKLSREPLCGSWKMFVMRTCPDCNNTAAVAAGQPFYMCTSLQCSTKSNLFCMFCDVPWAFGHTCAPPINMGTVKEMQRTEAAAANDQQLQNLLVRPCPRCPVRICTIDPHMCYHVTCGTCRLQYCGICPFVKTGRIWLHQCVDSNSIYKRSEPRRKAVLNAYEEALA